MVRQLVKKGIVFLLFFNSLFAGETIFGVHDYSLGILNPFYSASGMARSFEVAHSDTLRLNFVNYATWTAIKNPTYAVKLGYNAAFSKDQVKSNYFNDYMNFQGGYLAIPIMKKTLVIGLGIQPWSNVEQSYLVEQDSVKKYLLIRGGLSKGTFNISYSFNRFLKIAVGYEYNFGEISRHYRLEFPSSDYPLKFEYQYRFYGNGMVASLFSQPVKKLSLGLVYRPSFTLKSRVRPQTSSVIVNKSSLIDLKIPAYYAFGLQYDFNPRTSIGTDIIYQKWKKEFKVDGNNPSNLMNDYFRMGMGFERRQSHKIFTSFWEKMDYRFGLFYGEQNFVSLGNKVKEYGLTSGISIPIKRFRSRLDLSFIVGKRGQLGSNQYEEVFTKFGITINANEVWFVKLED